MSCRLMPQYAKHMKRDPSGKGYTHLGSDGVLRTISGNDEVLDARGLDPEQIENILKVMPAGSFQREDFQDVDGTKVTSHEGLFHPAAGVLPPKRGVDEQEAAEKQKAANEDQTA